MVLECSWILWGMNSGEEKRAVILEIYALTVISTSLKVVR
jgi:hypothetical protein